MTDDAFGFSAARNRTADKLKNIQPSGGPPAPATLDAVDAAGESLGFKSREGEGALRPAGRRREIGPTLAINTRAPERVAIPFKSLSNNWHPASLFSEVLAMSQLAD